jgi:hypothetical protein
LLDRHLKKAGFLYRHSHRVPARPAPGKRAGVLYHHISQKSPTFLELSYLLNFLYSTGTYKKAGFLNILLPTTLLFPGTQPVRPTPIKRQAFLPLLVPETLQLDGANKLVCFTFSTYFLIDLLDRHLRKAGFLYSTDVLSPRAFLS